MKIRVRAGIVTAALAVLMSSIGVVDGNSSQRAKYIFFFLGDGMSSAQIQATEAYLTTINGGKATEAVDLLKSENRLNMSKMTYAGMQTTYDSHALMTDSASSATAFASGIKTLSGVIGMDDKKMTSYKSIAQLAHEKGMKVGILTSVSLDHATPAAYYASVPSRSDYNTIATQLANSGYEFFGGGGLLSPESPTNIWDLLEAQGYTVVDDRTNIEALKRNPTDKVVCINSPLQDASSMHYAIDRPSTNLSLAEMTEIAIASLYEDGRERRCKRGRNWFRYRARPDQDKGFFIMVEGGKIDWAGHANDAKAAIGDTLDFDDAVGVALDFYKKHPRETLIIVTGDHETGGMTIGHATTGYTAYYDRLRDQTVSFQYFNDHVWPLHVNKFKAAMCAREWKTVDDFRTNPDIIADVKSSFGVDYGTLNDYQKEKLEDAYDKSMCGSNNNSAAENTSLYGSYNPITVTLTHILNERASIGWTSYSHTGVPVPVFSEGWEAWRFAGFYDNTDIAKKLANAIGMTLPVIR